MVPICPQSGARRCLLLLLFLCFLVVIGFLIILYFAGFRPFEETEETEFERKFNAMLKAENLTGKISGEMIQHVFESVALQKTAEVPTEDRTRTKFFFDATKHARINERLEQLAAIKGNNTHLFNQTGECNN